MNIKLTVYLTAVLAAAIIVAVFVINPRNKRIAGEKITEKRVFNTDIGNVNNVEIRNAHGDFVLQQSGPGKWEITSPVHTNADNATAYAIVDGIKSLNYENEIGKGSLSAFGLSPASITATVTSSSNQVYRLEIGTTTPVGQYYYARADNGHKGIFTIAGWFKNKLDDDLFQLRDKNILSLSADSITAISITKDSRPVYTLRESHNVWAFTKPSYDRIQPSIMDNMLSKLHSLSAVNIIDNPSDVKSMGLEKPSEVISIVFMDNRHNSIKIGKNTGQGKVYASVSGQGPVYIIKKDELAIFNNPVHAAIDNRLLIQDKWAVSSIMITKNGRTVILNRKSYNEWYKNGSRFTNSTYIDKFLDKLASLNAAKFVDNTGLFKRSAITFTVTGTTRPTMTTVSIGNKNGNTVYAKTSIDPRLAVLNAVDVNALETYASKIYQ